jgi:hypothetical protein
MNALLAGKGRAVSGRQLEGRRGRHQSTGDRDQQEDVESRESGVGRQQWGAGGLEREAMTRKSDSSIIVHHSSISFGKALHHKAIRHRKPLPPPSGDTG